MELDLKPICPARLLDALKGIKQVERVLLDVCIAQGVSVYVRIPSKIQVHILGHDKFKGGPCIDIDNDPFDDVSKILIDYSFTGGVVFDARRRNAGADAQTPVAVERRRCRADGFGRVLAHAAGGYRARPFFKRPPVGAAGQNLAATGGAQFD